MPARERDQLMLDRNLLGNQPHHLWIDLELVQVDHWRVAQALKDFQNGEAPMLPVRHAWRGVVSSGVQSLDSDSVRFELLAHLQLACVQCRNERVHDRHQRSDTGVQVRVGRHTSQLPVEPRKRVELADDLSPLFYQDSDSVSHELTPPFQPHPIIMLDSWQWTWRLF